MNQPELKRIGRLMAEDIRFIRFIANLALDRDAYLGAARSFAYGHVDPATAAAALDRAIKTRLIAVKPWKPSLFLDLHVGDEVPPVQLVPRRLTPRPRKTPRGQPKGNGDARA